MTALIVIDESGDLGSKGSRFFSMSAIIVSAPRDLRDVARLVPGSNNECKFYNSTNEEKIDVLTGLSNSSLKIVYVVIEKNNPESKKFVYGNELYHMMLRELVPLAMAEVEQKDVNVIVDKSRFITLSELKDICLEAAEKEGKNLKKYRKGVSQNEPCIRLVDFVAGSIGSKYESSNDKYFEIIFEKISIARKY